MLFHFWERYRVFILASVILLFLTLSYLYYPGTSTIEPSIPFQTPVYASEQTTPSSPSPKQNLNTNGASSVSQTAPCTKEEEKELFVDVKGQVKQPGIYSFSANERVHQIILRAGGLLPSADRNKINLAMPLSDGMVVWVPSVADKASLPLASPPASHMLKEDKKINLNSATLDELTSLPGIGETKAKAILAHREKKGGFKNVTELLEVTGIGEKMIEKIKEKVSL